MLLDICIAFFKCLFFENQFNLTLMNAGIVLTTKKAHKTNQNPNTHPPPQTNKKTASHVKEIK